MDIGSNYMYELLLLLHYLFSPYHLKFFSPLFLYMFSSCSRFDSCSLNQLMKTNAKVYTTVFKAYPKPTVSCPPNLCFPDFNVHRNHLRILWLLIQWDVKFSISNKLPPDAHASALKSTLWGASLHCIETEDWCPTWPVKLFSCIPFIFNRHSYYK